ncbi:MAG: phosphotransacetylase family protein [Deltaproteobacteria bacterium]|nr:phosphotransacetylase family protein [Deltaproteobacteria bacterium]
MLFLFVGSTGDGAGHTLVTWAIARRLAERGLKVGFVKPVGTHPVQADGVWTDQDALLFKEALNLPETLSEICPHPLSEDSWKEMGSPEILTDLKGFLQKVSAGKDVLIIMGSRHVFFDDATGPLPDSSLIPALKADFILVHRPRKISKSIYSILSIYSLLKDNIRGIVFNRVTSSDLPSVRERVLPSLIRKGVPATTALPEDPFLSYRSLREIGEVLKAQILCREGSLEQPIASITVGSADLSGGLLIFKRAYNKIVFLAPGPPGGENGALQGRPVAGILLTAGRQPAPQLLQAAAQARIPLLLVQDDTFAALERLEQSPSILSFRDEVKVRRFTELMERDRALDRLLERLRLPL